MVVGSKGCRACRAFRVWLQGCRELGCKGFAGVCYGCIVLGFQGLRCIRVWGSG